MKTRIYSLLALLPLLMLLAGCSEMDSYMDKIMGKKMTLTASMPSDDMTTRVGLSEMNASKNMLAQWQDDDMVQLFVCQGDETVSLGKVPVYEISNDKKRATFNITLPMEINVNKQYFIYAFCGIDATTEINSSKTMNIVLKAELTRTTLQKFRAPMYCVIKATGNNLPLAQFKHLGTYELLHVKNATNRQISFRHNGYESDYSKWYLTSAYLRFTNEVPVLYKSDYYNEQASETVSIPANNTQTFISWYYPSGEKITGAKISSNLNSAYTISDNKKSSNISIQRGHAYHLYATWDGSSLRFENGDVDEVKTISVVPDNIDFGSVEVGKSISETFTICNTGNASVAYYVMPLHNEFDIIDSGSGDILHAGESRTYLVKFTPEIKNHDYESIVEITSDASNGTQYVYLKGTSKKAGGEKKISVSPEHIDFGTIAYGKSKKEEFVITNTGDAAITYEIESMHGIFDIQESGKKTTLQSGDSKTIAITFKPDGKGKDYSSVVNITSDASNGTQHIIVQGNSKTADADEKILMLTTNVEGTTYNIYKQILNRNDVRVNPDNWKCYRSALTLDVTKNGSTKTYTLDNNIYLDEESNHHGGQRPCMLINFKTKQLFVFMNSKDSRNNYTMDGYCYISSLDNLNFTREKVFSEANWGWSPFFMEISSGLPTVVYFSFAGYYAVRSTRQSNGSWTTEMGNNISPEDFEALSLQAGNVLVIYDNGSGTQEEEKAKGKITNVKLTSTEYHRDETYTNHMYFTITAQLDDLTDVQEWGIYFDGSQDKQEFAFDNVSREQSLAFCYKNGKMQVDINNYVAILNYEAGVYVKKRNRSTGQQTTLYSDKYSFTLRYDTKPSLVLSNPKIVKTEITGYTGGEPDYKSYITHDYEIKGAFWVEYVDSDVSGGNWSFKDKSMNPYWYPEKDGKGELSWTATYHSDTELNHTNWRVMHLRNSKTVNSNYVNFSGQDYLTEAWVSSTPVYTAMRRDNNSLTTGGTSKGCGYISISLPSVHKTMIKNRIIKETYFKGGALTSYRK